MKISNYFFPLSSLLLGNSQIARFYNNRVLDFHSKETNEFKEQEMQAYEHTMISF